MNNNVCDDTNNNYDYDNSNSNVTQLTSGSILSSPNVYNNNNNCTNIKYINNNNNNTIDYDNEEKKQESDITPTYTNTLTNNIDICNHNNNTATIEVDSSSVASHTLSVSERETDTDLENNNNNEYMCNNISTNRHNNKYKCKNSMIICKYSNTCTNKRCRYLHIASDINKNNTLNNNNNNSNFKIVQVNNNNNLSNNNLPKPSSKLKWLPKSNVAQSIMNKMGYVEGKGLGKHLQGIVEPIAPSLYYHISRHCIHTNEFDDIDNNINKYKNINSTYKFIKFVKSHTLSSTPLQSINNNNINVSNNINKVININNKQSCIKFVKSRLLPDVNNKDNTQPINDNIKYNNISNKLFDITRIKNIDSVCSLTRRREHSRPPHHLNIPNNSVITHRTPEVYCGAGVLVHAH